MPSKLLEREGHRASLSVVAETKGTRSDDPIVAAAREQDGNTVLRFPDRSTITLVGVARLDQLTLFAGGRLRTIRRVV